MAEVPEVYHATCPDCGFTCTTTEKLHIPHVCAHTLKKHTLRVI